MEDQPHAIQCIRNLPFFIAGPASFVPSRRCTLAAPLPYLGVQLNVEAKKTAQR
jgi:hypothetical protein